MHATKCMHAARHHDRTNISGHGASPAPKAWERAGWASSGDINATLFPAVKNKAERWERGPRDRAGRGEEAPGEGGGDVVAVVAAEGPELPGTGGSSPARPPVPGRGAPSTGFCPFPEVFA